MKIDNIDLGDFPVAFAPMEDVSDAPFRKLCKRFGADIVYTEFVASDGIIRNIDKSLDKMRFDEIERPVGIQIFGNNKEILVQSTKIATEFNPDLIDINFGCSVKKIASKGSGSGIMKYPEKMLEFTKAVVDATYLPVTVKTRLGYDEDNKIIVEIAEKLQDVGIKAICIHGRTRSQLFKGNADWTLIGKVKNNPRINIPVIGNGDIDSPEKAKTHFDKYGVDGIMIGRAAIGNPWIFNQVKYFIKNGDLLPSPEIKERVNICKEHLITSVKNKGEKRTIFEMRKHYGNYFKGYHNFKNYRIKLTTSKNLDEIIEVLDSLLKIY